MIQCRWLLAVVVIAARFGSGCGVEPAASPEIPEPDNLAQVSEARLVEAVQQARAAVGEAPDSAAAWGRLGHVFMAHGWADEASLCYRQAVSLEPRVARWHYYLGRSRLGLEPTEAVDALQTAQSLEPAYAPTHLFLAEALRHLGRLEEAREHSERALALDPGNQLAEQVLGELAAADGRLEEARAHLERVLRQDSRQSKAHAVLARVYMAMDLRSEAERHALAARAPAPLAAALHDPLWARIQEAGATVDWYGVRGGVYLHRGDFRRAATELEVAVAANTLDTKVWLNYGLALLGLERTGDAHAALERALELIETGRSRPQSTPETQEKVLVNLGITSAKTGDTGAAARYLETALDLNPTSADATNNLAVLLYQQGRQAEAIAMLETARQVAPTTAGLRFLVLMLRGVGRTSEALIVEAELPEQSAVTRR